MSSQNKNELALGYVIEAFYGQSMTPNDTENNRKRLRKTSRTKQYSSMVLATIHSFIHVPNCVFSQFIPNCVLESVLQTVQKQFTYREYIQTYTEDNVQNRHTYTQYTQCTIRHTYSYQYTYTLCTHSKLCTHMYTQ